ncbi:hypothetical protein ACFX13_030323 [Malus domestica]
MSNCTVESCTFETGDGVKLSTQLFKPREEKDIKEGSPVVVMMHPYSIHGVCQGLLRGIAAGLADKGYKALSFDMRGVEMSTERVSLTGFAEIKDVISVCKWVNFNECMSRCREPKDCVLLREDYLECLHHSKKCLKLALMMCAPLALEDSTRTHSREGRNKRKD